MREQDRARGADLNVERVPDDRPPVGVQEHRHLVVRRVLELLHHQLSALRSRPPVHLAKRLALLVLAHAVQIEAGSPAEQHPAAALAQAGILREEALEVDEPRVDEERRLASELGLGAGQPEGILEDRPHGLEAVAAAGHAGENVAREQRSSVPREPHTSLAETPGVLDDLERVRARVALRLRLEPDRSRRCPPDAPAVRASAAG